MSERQLFQLYRKLRREYPELIGLGIGHRHRRGEFTERKALKLVVARKRSARAKGVRQFPKQLELPTGRGKRPVVLKLRTDVEEAADWVPTGYPLNVGGGDTVIATCYAAWNEPGGAARRGVITVAHALATLGQPVTVQTPTGEIAGTAYLRSDLLQDGVDVGLVVFEDLPPTAPDILPAPLNPGAASTSETVDLLGDSDTDTKYTTLENWTGGTADQGRALAFYAAMTVGRAPGPVYELRNVVFADSTTPLYSPGKSGSPWLGLTATRDRVAFALQSHGNQGLEFRTGLGTHLAFALYWLGQQTERIQNLTWAWRLADL